MFKTATHASFYSETLKDYLKLKYGNAIPDIAALRRTCLQWIAKCGQHNSLTEIRPSYILNLKFTVNNLQVSLFKNYIL